MAKTSWKRAAEALDNVRPGLSRAARQILLGQAYAETYFGNELPDGTNTHNWGSIGGSGDLGYYEWPDTVEGKKIIRKIAKFSTPEKGAERFAKVVLDTYKAGKYAETGDAWGYARALWRDGPNNPELGAPSKAPAYYGGFPPGHKSALAPAGVKQRSKLDDWYRVTAYARLVLGAAKAAAAALGEPLEVRVVEPPKPDAESTESLPATALGLLGDALGGGGGEKKETPTKEEMEKAYAADEELRRKADEEARAAEAKAREAEEIERAKQADREAAEKAEREQREKQAKADAEAAKGGGLAGAKAPAGKQPAGASGATGDNTTVIVAALGLAGLAWLLLRK